MRQGRRSAAGTSSSFLLLPARKRGVVDRIARLPRQIWKQRGSARVLESRLARQPRRRRAFVEDVVVAGLALPVLDAMAGCFEILTAAERVDGIDRFDERVAIVKGHLHFEPLDITGILL